MQFLELMTKDLVGQLSLFTVAFATVIMFGLPIYLFLKGDKKKGNQK
jgi:hypothetical protein